MPLFKGSGHKSKPNKVIAYVTDKEKAVLISSQAMDDTQDYAKQFKETCKMFGKGSGYDERKYYHFKADLGKASGGGSKYYGWGSVGMVGMGIGLSAISSMRAASKNSEINKRIKDLEIYFFYNNVASFLNKSL